MVKVVCISNYHNSNFHCSGVSRKIYLDNIIFCILFLEYDLVVKQQG